jgi:excisionase family DNA binding protein
MPQITYLSAMTAARELDVCEQTVRRWIRSGQLPVIRFGPRTVRIERPVFEEFVMNRVQREEAITSPT